MYLSNLGTNHIPSSFNEYRAVDTSIYYPSALLLDVGGLPFNMLSSLRLLPSFPNSILSDLSFYLFPIRLQCFKTVDDVHLARTKHNCLSARKKNQEMKHPFQQPKKLKNKRPTNSDNSSSSFSSSSCLLPSFTRVFLSNKALLV